MKGERRQEMDFLLAVFFWGIVCVIFYVGILFGFEVWIERYQWLIIGALIFAFALILYPGEEGVQSDEVRRTDQGVS